MDTTIHIGSHAEYVITEARKLADAAGDVAKLAEATEIIGSHAGEGQDMIYAAALGRAQTFLAELCDIIEGKRP